MLAVRASPDWAGLAEDHAAGKTIEPSRFMPAKHKRFPLDIPDHIARWNRLSGVSFWACRERIRAIAAGNLASVADVTMTRADDVPALLERTGAAPALLFFHDDDDWFHPEMVRILRESDLDLAAIDVVVTPFFRLAKSLVTFTQGAREVPGGLGEYEAFRYRYCTNNYGLTGSALRTGPADLVEHIDASAAGDEKGFVDVHLDVVISATNKSPCSAAWVRELPDTPAAFREHVRTYVEVVSEACDSSPHEWVNAPLRETRDLFLEVLD